jgi:hypothetical protein
MAVSRIAGPLWSQCRVVRARLRAYCSVDSLCKAVCPACALLSALVCACVRVCGLRGRPAWGDEAFLADSGTHSRGRGSHTFGFAWVPRPPASNTVPFGCDAHSAHDLFFRICLCVCMCVRLGVRGHRQQQWLSMPGSACPRWTCCSRTGAALPTGVRWTAMADSAAVSLGKFVRSHTTARRWR